MSAAPRRGQDDSPVVLLCPKCGKRLPLSGPISMLGTTGVYCRGCCRTVRVSIQLGDTDRIPPSVEG